ncbi:PREDICTED: uncharacterized protein LOC109480979 [Branchiostoma belcheri]|uniref:Uncharacterized protein LOC109480979 n=1 Tax=Branchiostoma belcheri TaxID=7741 RepID=A0A6P4ZY54_BRABE|nr:PREDICTED: uncharacterized protein LOC109480979 [Branchiostoma belcheri]
MSSGGGIDSHIENINRLCRFCGEFNLTKAEKDKKLSALNCELYAPKIKEIWGIEVARDRPYLHPKFFCRKCRSRLYNPPKLSRAKRISWYPHTFGSDCVHCSKVESLRRGGRRPINKSSGKPKTKTSGITTESCDTHPSPACEPVTTSVVHDPPLVIHVPPTRSLESAAILPGIQFGPPGAAFSPCCPPSIQLAAAAVSLRPSIQPAAAAVSLRPSIQPAAVPCPPSMQCWPVAVPAPLCPQPGVSGPVTSNRVTVDLNEEGPLTPDQQAALCVMVKRQMVDRALYVKTGGKVRNYICLRYA